jgi:hypothetical protein
MALLGFISWHLGVVLADEVRRLGGFISHALSDSGVSGPAEGNSPAEHMHVPPISGYESSFYGSVQWEGKLGSSLRARYELTSSGLAVTACAVRVHRAVDCRVRDDIWDVPHFEWGR